MAEYNFTLWVAALADNETFLTASAEELRVLFVLSLKKGRTNTKEIAKLAKVSEARAKSAVALWQGEGVLKETGLTLAEDGILEEFEHDVLKEVVYEERSVDVAKQIRDEGLASVISECARLMKCDSLNTTEIKAITALYTQLGLSNEYIITLAAYLASKGKLTPAKLKDKAASLYKKGTDTLEELEIYIRDRERITGSMWEIHRIFGYGRKPSDREAEYYARWSEEYGYGEAVVKEAYSVATMTVDRNIKKYMDAVLKSWHTAGCKTVSDCQVQESKFSEEFKKERKRKAYTKGKEKEATPKYADFESENALLLALQRSYGNTDKKD